MYSPSFFSGSALNYIWQPAGDCESITFSCANSEHSFHSLNWRLPYLIYFPPNYCSSSHNLNTIFNMRQQKLMSVFMCEHAACRFSYCCHETIRITITLVILYYIMHGPRRLDFCTHNFIPYRFFPGSHNHSHRMCHKRK